MKNVFLCLMLLMLSACGQGEQFDCRKSGPPEYTRAWDMC
jgi:hypothetical protein